MDGLNAGNVEKLTILVYFEVERTHLVTQIYYF